MQLELYKKRVEEIDDDYSKHCFTKYVWLKEKAADYMPGVLSTAETLFKAEKNDTDTKKLATATPTAIEDRKGIFVCARII